MLSFNLIEFVIAGILLLSKSVVIIIISEKYLQVQVKIGVTAKGGKVGLYLFYGLVTINLRFL